MRKNFKAELKKLREENEQLKKENADLNNHLGLIKMQLNNQLGLLKIQKAMMPLFPIPVQPYPHIPLWC